MQPPGSMPQDKSIIDKIGDVVNFIGGVTANSQDAARRVQYDTIYSVGTLSALRQLETLAGNGSGSAPNTASKSYARGLATRLKAELAIQGVTEQVVTQVVQPGLNAAGYDIYPKINPTTILLFAVAAGALYFFVVRK